MAEPFWYDLGDAASELAPGSIVQVPLMSKTVPGVVLEIGRPELAFRTKPIQAAAPGGARVPAAWLELLAWLSAYYFTPLPQVFATCLPKAALDQVFKPAKVRLPKAPKRSRRKQAVATVAEVDRLEGPAESGPATVPVQAPEAASVDMGDHSAPAAALRFHPTPEQASALAAIGEALSPPSFKAFLLHGITGSGKTFVYLHLARQALALGRRVLVLLPEIALTPQALARFRAFLGRPVLALHSNLSAAERRELWRAVFAHEADVIVGARSAVLCPIDNLGLIVVDEEHDGSYKQSDASPRYNARDLALWRGRREGCPVVLGSATPALESYHAAQAGKYRLLEMHARATGSSKPKVRIVDMREQHDLQGGQPLSIPLREAVQTAIGTGGQAILFLNRRGYANRRLCRDCGRPRECPHCITPLVYHKGRAALICHYCGYQMPASAPCLACGGKDWLDVGRGIEKIEEWLDGIFPGAGIARLDRDTTSAIGGAERILEDFRRGEQKLLIGTQMVAKGHDFPKVNVVGVLDADAGLGLSDFRAQERAFQLITQVAGRAGRHGEGEVFLQTYRPDNPLLAFALDENYAAFYAAEIERRRELDYPPFRRLLLVEISGTDEALVDEHMRAFAAAFRPFAEQAEIQVLGPAFAALKKLKDHYRAHLVAKGKAPNQMQWAFHQALERYQPKHPQKTKLRADMDPLAML
ncbi:MAG: primosomal protein N' [Fibrobacteres bacterium]|nr:primosomal protein N' [Fibrobacterota bacterium]